MLMNSKTNNLPMLLDKPTNKLLDDFGAGKAAPGSGSAAALMALLSIKLISTVCKISKKHKPYRESVYVFIEEQALQMEPRLRELFEKDAKDFEEVVKLRKLRDKAEGTSEKNKLSRQANNILEKANRYTLEITKLSLDILPLAIQIFNEGWESVRGDSGAAISAASSGAMSGIFITNLNLKSLAERKSSNNTKYQCDRLFSKLMDKQKDIFECMRSINTEAADALDMDTDNQLLLIFEGS